MAMDRKTHSFVQDAVIEPEAKSKSSNSAVTVYLRDWQPTITVKQRKTLQIEGTRTPASAIVGYKQLGFSVNRIVKAMPHLTRRQVEDILDLYQRDKKVKREIDEEIGAQEA